MPPLFLLLNLIAVVFLYTFISTTMRVAIMIKVGSLEAVKRAAPRALPWVAMRVYCAKPLLPMSKMFRLLQCPPSCTGVRRREEVRGGISLGFRAFQGLGWLRVYGRLGFKGLGRFRVWGDLGVRGFRISSCQLPLSELCGHVRTKTSWRWRARPRRCDSVSSSEKHKNRNGPIVVTVTMIMFVSSRRKRSSQVITITISSTKRRRSDDDDRPRHLHGHRCNHAHMHKRTKKT